MAALFVAVKGISMPLSADAMGKRSVRACRGHANTTHQERRGYLHDGTKRRTKATEMTRGNATALTADLLEPAAFEAAFAGAAAVVHTAARVHEEARRTQAQASVMNFDPYYW